MKIYDFLNTDFFSLPKERKTTIDFKEYVFNNLDEFLRLLNGLNKTEYEFEDCRKRPISSIINFQNILINQIKNSIEKYYEGKPSEAFLSLSNGLNNDNKSFKEELYLFRFTEYYNFYRIRKNMYVNSPEDFFHIPFQLRRKVDTQRFSIPGFPALYLGTSLKICWEELKRPKIDEFQAVRLQNVKHLRVLNLVPPPKKYPLRLYNFLMTWPLIFCTSVKVSYPNDPFKPEYIISQLLLQWIRENKNIDGIMYLSTHFNVDIYAFEQKHLNVVLPVKENKSTGYCDALKEKFEVTSAIAYNLTTNNKNIPCKDTKSVPNSTILDEMEARLMNYKTQSL